jgi:hypothetical protein
MHAARDLLPVTSRRRLRAAAGGPPHPPPALRPVVVGVEPQVARVRRLRLVRHVLVPLSAVPVPVHRAVAAPRGGGRRRRRRARAALGGEVVAERGARLAGSACGEQSVRCRVRPVAGLPPAQRASKPGSIRSVTD